jgi:glyoxylase-like metal-dependent hydrolase (beta-lactamase superfamily II)
MSFAVRSIKTGQVDVPGPELFWMSAWDTWHTLALQMVLIQGPGVTALVNTGPPPDLTPINELWMAGLGPRAELVRLPDEDVVGSLARLGIAPKDVTHVILSPFQLYTTGNVALFTNAEICVSKRGWVHYHTTHDHPHDVRWNSISREVLVHLVTDAWDRVRLLADEDTIVPGLRTWWTGGHHRASLAVEVESSAGTVVISDSFFHYENVEEGRILGITENMYEAMAAYDRARDVADHLVPLYDPKVFDRYPDGIVSPG